jgi:hypothetical protein
VRSDSEEANSELTSNPIVRGSKYRNTGQARVCANRIPVQDGAPLPFPPLLAEEGKGGGSPRPRAR